MKYKQVTRNVACNPVARAIAKQALQSSTRDFKVRLYLTPTGETCADWLDACAFLFQSALLACKMQSLKNPHVNTLDTALAAIVDMTEANAYDASQTVLLDNALDSLVAVSSMLTADNTHRAYLALVNTTRYN